MWRSKNGSSVRDVQHVHTYQVGSEYDEFLLHLSRLTVQDRSCGPDVLFHLLYIRKLCMALNVKINGLISSKEWKCAVVTLMLQIPFCSMNAMPELNVSFFSTLSGVFLDRCATEVTTATLIISGSE